MSELYEYGIMQEKSDARAHVCPVVQRIYVFDTEAARKAIREGNHPIRDASQDGIDGRTATGWLVPVSNIPGIVSLRVRECTWQALDFSPQHSPSHKGREAVRLVTAMIKRGCFPFPAYADSTVDLSTEIDGTDIIASTPSQDRHIQVKCDRRGGRKELGGTGNLFLQKAERNPLDRHEGEQRVGGNDLFG